MADPFTLPPEILAQLASKRLGFETGANSARQQSDQNYSDLLNQLATFSADQARSIDDNFASRGTFNSGIRVDSQGRLQKNVGERQGQLGTQHSNELTNIQNLLNQQLQGVEDQTSQYALDFNRTQAEQALADAQNAANANPTDLQNQITMLQQQIGAPQQAPAPPGAVGATLGLIAPKPPPVNRGITRLQ